MPAIIISAFPGCGKTYYYNHRKVYNKYCLDSDSSQFSWIINPETNEKVRNPEFPNNYIKHIKSNMDNYDVIFVSSHSDVRDALTNACIKYYIVYPERTMKNSWLQRLRDRDTGLNDAKFVNMLNENWDSFISGCEDDKFGIQVILTESKPYLSQEVVAGMIELYDAVKDDNKLLSITVSENKPKTYLNDFKSKFPNMMITTDRYIYTTLCRNRFYGINNGECERLEKYDCVKCWNDVMEDKK